SGPSACCDFPGRASAWRSSSRAPDAGALLEDLMGGNLEAVLRSPQVVDLLAGDAGRSEGEDLEAFLERRVLWYLDGGSDEDRTNRQLAVMALAAACLHLFAQSNWTGPTRCLTVSLVRLSLSLSLCLCPSPRQPSSLDEAVLSSLLLDGESVYPLVSNPLLLLLSRVVLTRCSSRMDGLQLLPWWTLRYVKLHQQILEATSPQLFTLSTSLRLTVLCMVCVCDQRALAVQFHLECVYTCLTYYEYQPAKEHIQEAQQLSGLDVNLTGALGKRTRFQQKFLAQLFLEVKKRQEHLDRPQDEATPTPTPKESLPKDCSLADDTVLDNISFADADQLELPDLSAEEQAVVLGLWTFGKFCPDNKRLFFFCWFLRQCILSQPKFWAVEVMALCLRTKLEKGKSRRVERAMMQMQAIVDHYEDESCPVTERLKVFYCCQAPPRWAVQKQLAGLLTELGCLSSALLAYERLQLWEDVVVCHERLGQHGKAEEIVRRELEKKETPSLYCLLGDILRDHQYYDRAWELSGRRSARAMRSKALLHLRGKEFQQCVECFERSLQINAMQLGVWFSLGCAYFALEGYDGAARAFQRCVSLEPDNAEAWNNLSTAYIRLQKKNKAFHTLQEALRCNFEHWQIWENFIVVSTDIGEFAESITAYHRLMDLRDGYKDIQILQILVRAVVGNLSDCHGQKAADLQSKLKELLGRVSSRHSGDAEVWRQYALLYGGGRGSSQEDNEKALHFLSKAHRCEVQAAGWDKEPALFKDVIQRAIHLGEVTIACSEKKSNATEALQMLSSTRLSLRSLATKAKQLHTDVATGQLHGELRDGVDALERLVAELQQLSAGLRGQSQ
uniref:Tetratricopeptide repeat protein 27 n=1 Tax=Salarias fasciatus TaxID=181472 RepID=A0A672FP63_SALFA